MHAVLKRTEKLEKPLRRSSGFAVFPCAWALMLATCGPLLVPIDVVAQVVSGQTSATSDSARAPLNMPRLTTGAELMLTNSGFGIGGNLRDSLSINYALMIEVVFGSIKDEREDAFFNRLGERSIPDKANYLLVLPTRIGIQRRLFRNQIEDSFRPFVQITAGPTIGWLYPYFDDCNANGSFEPVADCDANGVQEEGEGEVRLSQSRGLGRGEVRIGGGGSVGLGAYIRYGRRGARGFRISYAFDYFTSGINLLETDVRGSQKFFGTPSIVVFFGHLL